MYVTQLWEQKKKNKKIMKKIRMIALAVAAPS